jgi:acetylornithine deacetylase/succinyl-diaminopimelate desuccinylase-like protein
MELKMPDPINWEAATNETVNNLIRLIQVESVNPPGNEEPAVLLIKEILESAGFPDDSITIVESAPKRSNLVARLRGDGSQRPLMLSGHVDVVPVEREHWTRDPFSGEVYEGCVWGRGALDMKGFLAMYLQIFLMAYRRQLPMKRDLILAAIADEEAGFEHGSKFLVDEHRDLVGAEYALNEGGALTIHAAGKRLYPIQVAEKGACWLRMTASGEPGHGSIPNPDNAVLQLSNALHRLGQAGHLPIHITPTLRLMFESLSSQLGFPLGILLRLMKSPSIAGLFVRLMKGDVGRIFVPILSNSVSPTILKAGQKANVIPSIAQADLDCRLLPGQTPDDVIREITKITGEDIDLEILFASTGAEFSTRTPLYKLLEKATRTMDPQGIIFPLMMPGATDAAEYKRAGITVYGFTPGILPEDFPLLSLAHGHDERLPISYIQTGLPALWQVVHEFCA